MVGILHFKIDGACTCFLYFSSNEIIVGSGQACKPKEGRHNVIYTVEFEVYGTEIIILSMGVWRLAYPQEYFHIRTLLFKKRYLKFHDFL